MKKTNKFLFFVLSVFCFITTVHGDSEEKDNSSSQKDSKSSNEKSSDNDNSGRATTWEEAFDRAVKHPSDAAPWEP